MTAVTDSINSMDFDTEFQYLMRVYLVQGEIKQVVFMRQEKPLTKWFNDLTSWKRTLNVAYAYRVFPPFF